MNRKELTSKFNIQIFESGFKQASCFKKKNLQNEKI